MNLTVFLIPACPPHIPGISHFMKMLGPALGLSLASLCLKIFIEPSKTPLITSHDPRWIGAWWIGMLVLGVLCTLTAFLISLFPKRMPRYVAKLEFQKLQERNGKEPEEKVKLCEDKLKDVDHEESVRVVKSSWADFGRTMLRILKNKIFMLNLFGTVLYFFGCFPYWLFLSKYIEVQYRASASEAK